MAKPEKTLPTGMLRDDKFRLFIGVDPGNETSFAFIFAYRGVPFLIGGGRSPEISKIPPREVHLMASDIYSSLLNDLRFTLAEDLPEAWASALKSIPTTRILVENTARSMRPGQNPSAAITLCEAYHVFMAAGLAAQANLRLVSDGRVTLGVDDSLPQEWRSYFAMNQLGADAKNTKAVSIETAGLVQTLLHQQALSVVEAGHLDEFVSLAPDETIEGFKQNLVDGINEAEPFTGHNAADAFLLAARAFWGERSPEDKFFSPMSQAQLTH